MKLIGNWHVGDTPGGNRRAFCRTAAGCYAVTQPRGGGPFMVVRFACTAAVYDAILEDGGEFAHHQDEIKILDAVEVPAGLADALLT